MSRLSLLFLLIFSSLLSYSQSKQLEVQIYDWENNHSLEEINKEIKHLQSENGDKNLILTLESIAALKRDDKLMRMEILIRLSKRNEGVNNYYSIYSNYHVAASLNLNNIPSFALEYVDKAIRASKALHQNRELYLSYKTKAGIYFNMKSFERARRSFMDASATKGQAGLVEIASDYNNLALCDVELKIR